jgi:hypothetical protein
MNYKQQNQKPTKSKTKKIFFMELKHYIFNSFCFKRKISVSNNKI